MGLADILTPTVLNSLNKLAVILGYAVGSTPPSNPVEGQMWFDTNYQYFKIYDGTQWVNVEPKLAGAGVVTGDVQLNGGSLKIADSSGNIKLVLSTGSILPNGTGIDIGSLTNRFDDVYANTFNGSLSGNASSASKVNNSITFTSNGSGANSGASFNGQTAVTISYNTLGAAPATHSHTLASLSDTNISSLSNGQVLQYNSSTGKWVNASINTTVTASTYIYNSTGVTYAQTGASGNIIEFRNSTGTKSYINNNGVFYGTATSAYYADLAEKYTIKDSNVNVGDVILISENDNYDCELSNEVASYRVLGVVSENPAYMMNAGLENGTYIALKGRVKCKVKGKVKKGDPLVSYLEGCAISIFNEEVKGKDLIGRIFAKALESNNTDDVNIIEVVIL